MKWVNRVWRSIADGAAWLFGAKPVEDEPVCIITLRELRSYQDRLDAQTKLIRDQNDMIDELRSLTRRGL